nr:hypothetical protein [Tanacetum cinerariifolium]
MSSITAQQTKLNLKLVPKENRLDIEKCNGRIPRGLKPREPTFQVVLYALALTPCYSTFLITTDVPEVYMHQFWNSVPKMKESKAYKTYLGYASGAIRPKIARKFKKAYPSKKDSSLVYVDDETANKGKRVKRSAKKCTTTPAIGIVISEAPMEIQSKRKEKVDVAYGKGIELLSKVALAEKSQMKEVRKKSLREFHRTHPSGSGMIAETPPSVEKTKSSVTREGTGDKPGGFDVTKDDLTKNGSESESKSDRQEDEEEVKDDDEKEDEFAHTPPNTDDEEDTNLESKNDNKIKGDEDRGMNDTTNQFNDDVDARLNEPTQTDEKVVQDKKADVEMTDAQQEKENLEITQEQVVEDAHVMILTATKETEVHDASFSHSSDLASKLLIFLDIHPNDAEIVSSLDVHVHHEVPRTHTSTLLTVPVSLNFSPVCTTFPLSSQTFTSPLLLKTPTPPPTIKTSNTPSTIPDFASVFRFSERVNTMGSTREEFMNFLLASLTERITEQVKNQLPQILLKEVSNFAPPMIEKMIKESLNQVNLVKVSSQPQSTYEVAATLTEFELKKILIDKMHKSKSFLTAPEHRECYDGLIKSYNLENDLFSSNDVYLLKRSRKDKDKDEGPFAGSDQGFKKRKTSKDT